MDNNIIQDLKKKYLLDSIKRFLFFLLFLPFIIFLVIADVRNFSFDFDTLLMSVFILFWTILTFFLLSSSIKYFQLYLNPSKIDILEKYPDLDKIILEINNNSVYSDEVVSISDNYIVSKKDYRNLFKLDEILGVYLNVHKTNYVIDAYNIVITDKYNKTSFFTYASNQKGILDNAMNVLTHKCTNAKFGYNKETLNYIKENVTSK